MIPFNNDTYSFLPGMNVTITCSVPATGIVWRSSKFTNQQLLTAVGESGERLGGAIVFNLTSLESGPSCATSTATIVDIQEEPFQDLDLSCDNLGDVISDLKIDVIGK